MNAATRDYRRHGFPRKAPAARLSNWLLAIAMLAVLFALWTRASIDEERERAAAAEPAIQRHNLLQINLDDCPPPGEGTTDLVLFAIKTSADGQHRAEGCSRIAERPFMPRSARRGTP